MSSLIHQLLHSKEADDWRYFRLHRDKLAHLVKLLSDQTLLPQTQRIIFNAKNNNSSTLIVTESSSLISSPFTNQNNFFTLCYKSSLDKNNNSNSAFNTNSRADTLILNIDTENKSLYDLIDTFHINSFLQLKNDLFEILELESLRDKEGEELFNNLGKIIRSVFQADYVEFQPELPTEFAISRSPGWVWRDSNFPGQLLSILLVPRSTGSIYRRDTLYYIDDFSATKEIMNSTLLEIMGLKSGFILPVLHQNKKLGIIKNFYFNKVAMIPSDIEIIEQFRRKFSVLLDWCRLHLRAQKQAIVDGLTNLYNHRFFRDQLKLEFQRAHRYHKKMTLIMVDIDDFKHFNDTYGHLAGDRALTDIANTIRKAVRDIDFVARYGGEEFALILPEVNLKNGLLVAEKIRKAVESKQINVDEGNTLAPLTVSCGVTDNESAKGPDDLIERADRALYWVKRHGRNLVRAESVTMQN